MAKLSSEDVLKLANLAKLELSKDEVELFRSELSDILGYVEQLQKVNTKGLKPTYQVTGLASITRPDEVIDYGYTQQDLLKNVPTSQNGHIKVKRVLQ